MQRTSNIRVWPAALGRIIQGLYQFRVLKKWCDRLRLGPGARAERAGSIGWVAPWPRRSKLVSAGGGGGLFPAPSTKKSAPCIIKEQRVIHRGGGLTPPRCQVIPPVDNSTTCCCSGKNLVDHSQPLQVKFLSAVDRGRPSAPWVSNPSISMGRHDPLKTARTVA